LSKTLISEVCNYQTRVPCRRRSLVAVAWWRNRSR